MLQQLHILMIDIRRLADVRRYDVCPSSDLLKRESRAYFGRKQINENPHHQVDGGD
jgi:hypothetical protein